MTKPSLLLPLLLPLPALSQTITPTPDGTGTLVNYNGNTYTITGGTQAGANLFHSFSELGLSPNQIANFLSTPNIQNILGRITGGNPSIIQGLISVTGGNSNLFLMNPAGFVFGQNASINVPGDFTATTADAIGFNGGFFNATGDNDYSTLVGTPNSFAFASANPGSIVNTANLTLGDGQNLTLVGGSILNTGTLNAGGNITLAAVPGGKTVRINQEGMVLGIEVTPQSIESGISAVDLPRLLTNPNLRDATGVEVDDNGTIRLTGSSATLNPDGNVTIAGNVRGNTVNLAAANRVLPIGDPLTLIRTGDGTYSAPTVTLFPKTGSEPNAYIFLDSTIPDYSQFLYGGKPGTTTVVVTPVENGIEKITATLATEGINPIDKMHILSEGNAGEFWLGNAFVSSENVGQYQTQMQSWASNLAPGADILIYACLTALGESGSILLNSIADVTGADVAGSTTLTGSAIQGGDWVLERTTGEIEASNPFAQEILESYNQTLQVFTATTVAELIADINTANANGEADTIRLTPNGIYTLTVIDNNTDGDNGLPSILADGGNSLTIEGFGATIERDGAAPNFRIFHVSGGADLRLNNLTLRSGSTQTAGAFITRNGGAILNRGTLAVTGSTISGNTANLSGGGIYNRGDAASVATLTVTGSTISGNTVNFAGGGIFNSGSAANAATLTVTGSTISGNTANSGGGIFNSGIAANAATLTVTESTISGNTANSGGGIFNSGSAANAATVTVTGSTISGNTANSGGGIFNSGIAANAATLTVTESTISGNTGGNGGGIFNEGRVANAAAATLGNTIVAGNTATTADPDVGRNNATNTIFNDSGNNLIGQDTLGLFTTSTLVGTAANPLDPGIAPLGDYGGTTQIHALLPDSPALNGGSNALTGGATTDQRGANRIIGGTVDIGAFEADYLLVPTGTPQSADINAAFATPLSVQLTDGFTNTAYPFAGIDVTFAAPTSGASGSFGNGATLTTDANGIVTNPFTANDIGGTYQVTASAANITGATFDLTNVEPTVTTPVTPTNSTVTPTPTPDASIAPLPTQPTRTLTEPPESNTIPQPQSPPQEISEVALACISPNDPVLSSLEEALPEIAWLLGSGGGNLSINLRDLLRDCGENLSGLLGNQRLIRQHLLREIEEQLGAEVLPLVSVGFVRTSEGLTAIINVSP
ncbi:DUF4347 domain-containing protein [Lusitaniella coriacea LEGE 07157]|uniref:DUF4347 domain-containing protein n=1 Tax=Lusitaniella coriacea LEGE 07157 TaxID=945747 RepID=A0A8J7JE60_9CYAN|nr:DUF4347 domain-containing protein [Lusitaniella coriacea]MBE9118155.1 DUF4347 domain-containing protein [Lusitaniella coriacea LEGE 07157]